MNERSTAGDLGFTLGVLRELWSVNHAVERTSTWMELRIGVTAQQRLAIRVIGRNTGIAPGKLAGLLCVDAGTVSATVRRLVAKGLVKRKRSVVDGRQLSLSLTASGRALDVPEPKSVEAALEAVIERTGPAGTEAVRRFLGALSAELDARIDDDSTPED